MTTLSYSWDTRPRDTSMTWRMTWRMTSNLDHPDGVNKGEGERDQDEDHRGQGQQVGAEGRGLGARCENEELIEWSMKLDANL